MSKLKNDSYCIDWDCEEIVRWRLTGVLLNTITICRCGHNIYYSQSATQQRNAVDISVVCRLYLVRGHTSLFASLHAWFQCLNLKTRPFRWNIGISSHLKANCHNSIMGNRGIHTADAWPAERGLWTRACNEPSWSIYNARSHYWDTVLNRRLYTEVDIALGSS